MDYKNKINLKMYFIKNNIPNFFLYFYCKEKSFSNAIEEINNKIRKNNEENKKNILIIFIESII